MASISNLFVDQGSDFSITVSLTDATDSALSLAGSSFLAQVRKSHGSNTVKATFSTSNDGIGGNLTMNLTDVQTAALEAGRYVYDVLQTDASGEKKRLMEGQLIVTPSVSRS
jgi:hypothetical protein|tara:strand:+ start:566 stop:901 length:336 start_codon:yes stop_codon:yes gene_type:complete